MLRTPALPLSFASGTVVTGVPGRTHAEQMDKKTCYPVRIRVACLEEKAKQSKVACFEEKASDAKWPSLDKYASLENLDAPWLGWNMISRLENTVDLMLTRSVFPIKRRQHRMTDIC